MSTYNTIETKNSDTSPPSTLGTPSDIDIPPGASDDKRMNFRNSSVKAVDLLRAEARAKKAEDEAAKAKAETAKAEAVKEAVAEELDGADVKDCLGAMCFIL